MNEPHIDAEVIPETQALAIRHPGGQVGILRPADSLDAIAEAFKQYQAVCERILTEDDYQEYEGKKRKKKSAWRKLATAFNVSTEVVEKEIERDESRNVLAAFFTIRALAGTRQTNGSGYCEVTEKCCPTRTGGKCRKAAWKGHYCCENGCDGRKHWTHANHDIIATAETRAKNRAIADLIGCGEVSAEELTDEGTPSSPPPRQAAPPKPAPAAPAPAKPHPPTDKTRLWMLQELSTRGLGDLATEYFCKLKDPTPMMPGEALGNLRLVFVPNTRDELAKLIAAIEQFGNGDEPQPPYPWHWDAEEPQAKTPAAVLPKLATNAPGSEPWWDIIITMPRKGTKRADYLKNPDTIRSLFALRHGNDEEAQAARQRLWGLAEHFEAKPWTGNDGKERPPSAADVKCYEAIQQFKAWFAANHPDEKL